MALVISRRLGRYARTARATAVGAGSPKVGEEGRMGTGELRSQIDGVWNDFWSGGLSNPLQVIEQLTF